MRRWDRWALAVIVAIYITLGVLHTILVPLFEAPDEIWHFSFIEVMSRERTIPIQPVDEKDIWLREAGQPPIYHILFAPLVAPFDTSDLRDFVRFNTAHPAVNPGSDSEAPNVFIHTPYEEFPYRGSVRVVHLVRLAGLAWGAATIVGTYYLVRDVVPDRCDLAVAAAALVALNPHFVFISSVVNNDAAAAALCTWVLWLCIRLAGGRAGNSATVSLGVLLGLALLSKMSALALLPLVALALALAWWRDRDGRALLLRGAMVLAPAVVLSGWWYVRNWTLYGDPLAWSIWLQDIGVQRVTIDELLRQFGHVFTSYWAPRDGLFPQFVFWGLGALLVTAVAGWGLLIVRLAQRERPPQEGGLWSEGVLLSGVWLLLLFVSLIRYMTTTPSAEGRLLYPGIASFSLLVVLGWDAVLPRRWLHAAMVGGGAGLLTLAIASPLFAIAPLYRLPVLDARRPLPEMTSVDVTWDGLTLLGIRPEPEVLEGDDTFRVSVYWQVSGQVPGDPHGVVQLWSPAGRLLGHRDQVPASEAYPPDLWQVGDIVRDVYRIRVEEPGPALCHAAVSLRDGETELGKVTVPWVCELAPPKLREKDVPYRDRYALGERIELLGYELEGEGASAERRLPFTLYWRARDSIEQDYAVFVHLVDAEGNLVGQGDGPPLEGDYPTSAWPKGDILADRHEISLEQGLPAQGSLLVGLYRLSDGVRLPVYDPDGDRVPDDAIWIKLNDPSRHAAQ